MVKKYLILTRHYAPEPTGSAPVITEMARWLASSGRQVDVITVRPNYPQMSVFDGYRRGEKDLSYEDGVTVQRLRTMVLKRQGIWRRAIPELQFALRLIAKALSAKSSLTDPQIIISLSPSIFTVLAGSFFRRSQDRHVAIVHDIQSGLGTALSKKTSSIPIGLLKIVESYALNRADEVVTLSSGMKLSLQELKVRSPIHVLPPNLDTEVIRPSQRESNEIPILMYSGNLGLKQGLDQVLELASYLLRQEPAIKIVIRGDGALRNSLETIIAQEKLANVDLQQLVPQNEVAKALNEADLHIIPQLAAGSQSAVPSKAFAIMAVGRPFVAIAPEDSALGRLAEASGAGVVVPPNHIHRLIMTVTDLMADRPLLAAMGLRAREYAVKEADTRVVMASFTSIVEHDHER